MGGSTKEKSVLKLVHPGRHVEIYREPVTAAQIMSKYPRHCIARPDVFKFPYIVVRPDSLLLPGKVFYLVPKRTLHILLKTRGQQSQLSLRENQYPHNHGHHGYNSRNSPSKCSAGLTPKHQQNDRCHRRRSQIMLLNRTNSHDQDLEDYRSETSYSDKWNEITDKIRRVPNRTYQPSPAGSLIDGCTPFFSKGSHYHGHIVTSTMTLVRRKQNATSTLPTVMNVSTWTGNLGDHAKLKSCFRKQDSERKFLNLKVTFASPIIVPAPSSPKQTMWGCNQYN